MNAAYAQLLEAMVKKELSQQGEKALNLAKNVKEISVSPDGKVMLLGDGFTAVKRLAEEFKRISPVTIIFLKGVAEPFLKSNPRLKLPEELLLDSMKAKAAPAEDELRSKFGW